MNPRGKNKSTNLDERVARIGGKYAIAAAVAAAVIAGVFAILTKEDPPPPCPKQVEINSPKAGEKVDGIAGTEVTGTICGLESGESVWLFEHDSYDENSYLVYDPNVGRRPVASQNGEFAIHDGPIGDPGDQLKQYSIIAVVASGQCRATITSKELDADGNYVFPSMPPGCKVADQVQILESQA
jgi:hypothetical protein